LTEKIGADTSVIINHANKSWPLFGPTFSKTLRTNFSDFVRRFVSFLICYLFTFMFMLFIFMLFILWHSFTLFIYMFLFFFIYIINIYVFFSLFFFFLELLIQRKLMFIISINNIMKPELVQSKTFWEIT